MKNPKIKKSVSSDSSESLLGREVKTLVKEKLTAEGLLLSSMSGWVHRGAGKESQAAPMFKAEQSLRG